MFDSMTNFFTHPIFIISGGISSILFIFFLIPLLVYIWFYLKGIFSFLHRIGFGVTRKKIAIVTEKDDSFKNIKEILTDSKLFRDKNIIHVDKSTQEKALKANILILYWDECSNFFPDIIAKKGENTPLIVYVPPHCKEIDNENMKKINNTMNATLVRFRGRLLSDIFFSLIATKSDKKE